MSSAATPYHHGDLRSALLDAAEESLREGGAADISLRGLARELGVSHAAPRRHFADKQELLDAVAEVGWSRVDQELRLADETVAGEDLQAHLIARGIRYARFAIANPALIELMFAYKTSGRRPPTPKGMIGPSSIDLLIDARRKGDLAVSSGQLARSVWAQLQGIAALAIGGFIPDVDLDDAVAEGIERLMVNTASKLS
ncbi:MAG: TetR/AcrR family transcriptional regulator [Actinomycetota bacterium]|nr:TetR/AcrR family transcriptional regulator [Actinomycetota bacterium]